MDIPTLISVFILTILWTPCGTFSPPIGRNYFINLQQRMRSHPQPMLDAGFMRSMRGPPAMRTMAGPPGSYSNIIQQEQMIDKWYVAPPGGYFNRGDKSQQADKVRDVERFPIGPPGSDAASMGRELHYGPPAAVSRYRQPAAPPAPRRGRYRN